MNDRRSDAIVFYGASGDLAYKQIFPALQALIKRGRLDVPVVGVALSGWTLEQLRARARESLQAHGGVDEAAFAKLSSLLRYVDGDYNDPATYGRLREALGSAQHPLHYLAIPPSMFAIVAAGLANAGCTTGARVVVEKPFGRDLASAVELNRILHVHFPEQAIFRIDHYLGKEPVQNIFYTRFSNIWLEPIMNRVYVDHVQISMAAEGGTHRREQLLGIVVLAPRAEASIQRSADDGNRDGFVDRCLYRPAPLAGVRHMAAEGGEIPVREQRLRGKVEQP